MVLGWLAADAGGLAYFTVPTHTEEGHILIHWHLGFGLAMLAFFTWLSIVRWRDRTTALTWTQLINTLNGFVLLLLTAISADQSSISVGQALILNSSPLKSLRATRTKTSRSMMIQPKSTSSIDALQRVRFDVFFPKAIAGGWRNATISVDWKMENPAWIFRLAWMNSGPPHKSQRAGRSFVSRNRRQRPLHWKPLRFSAVA